MNKERLKSALEETVLLLKPTVMVFLAAVPMMTTRSSKKMAFLPLLLPIVQKTLMVE